MKKKETGHLGENIAAAFLKQKGYQILCRNFKCKLGEIDIIAQDGDAIVFVEVRTLSCTYYGFPFESILWKKKKKLTMLANFYINHFDLGNGNFRFDIVSIVKKEGIVDIKLIKDAFWEV